MYESFPQSRKVFERASSILEMDMAKLCFEGPAEQLKQTRLSQPAIVVVSLAAYEAFHGRYPELKPVFAAGLSLGEYTALIAAKAISFDSGLKLVRKRGEIMEEAARKFPGKMCAILDLDEEQITGICQETNAHVANQNCPGQIVIAGDSSAVEKAKAACMARGARRTVDLDVSGAFHSPFMFEASGELKKALERISVLRPAVPVISNYTASPENEPESIRQNLIYQMYSRVRWEESVRYMVSGGVKRFFEFGPGKVLRGFMRKIDPEAKVISIEKKDDIHNYAQPSTGA